MTTDINLELDAAVTRTRGVRGGQPCLAGTHIRVVTIVEAFLSGESHRDLAEKLGLTVRQVENANRWWWREQKRKRAKKKARRK